MQDNMTEQEEMNLTEAIEMAINSISQSLGYAPEKVSNSFKAAIRLGMAMGMAGVKHTLLESVQGLPLHLAGKPMTQICEEGLAELDVIQNKLVSEFTEAIKEHLITSEKPAQ